MTDEIQFNKLLITDYGNKKYCGSVFGMIFCCVVNTKWL
jgi:hypothetical protein